LDWEINSQNHLLGLHRSDCRLWSFITKSTRRVHTGESGIAEAPSKVCNPVAVTRADHGDHFPVPIPQSKI